MLAPSHLRSALQIDACSTNARPRPCANVLPLPCLHGLQPTCIAERRVCRVEMSRNLHGMFGQGWLFL